MNSTTALLSTAYFPPVQYFSKIISFQHILLEKKEHFVKQSYRNRCIIASASGPLALSIPVCHPDKRKIAVEHVEINYEFPWQKDHWKSIQTSYSNSPFFEFYQDELFKNFSLKPKYLFDFNLLLLEKINSFLKINPSFSCTEEYFPEYPLGVADFRNVIHPKPLKAMEDKTFHQEEYLQVFSDRIGFLPNLSILDLLFNRGPDALENI